MVLKLSPGFKLHVPGGGRQGDNLFPLLFDIVVHGLKILVDTSELTGVTAYLAEQVKT